MNLQEALARIEELEHIIGEQNLVIDDLENQVGKLEREIENSWVPVLDEDLEDLEERNFLRDIGLDPDRLPTSVGDRMMLRDRLQERPS